MKIYLVGGAVRDKLLGIEPKERDWVVVGSSPKEMKKMASNKLAKIFQFSYIPNRERSTLLRGLRGK